MANKSPVEVLLSLNVAPSGAKNLSETLFGVDCRIRVDELCDLEEDKLLDRWIRPALSQIRQKTRIERDKGRFEE